VLAKRHGQKERERREKSEKEGQRMRQSNGGPEEKG